jgi:hypothetical protein
MITTVVCPSSAEVRPDPPTVPEVLLVRASGTYLWHQPVGCARRRGGTSRLRCLQGRPTTKEVGQRSIMRRMTPAGETTNRTGLLGRPVLLLLKVRPSGDHVPLAGLPGRRLDGPSTCESRAHAELRMSVMASKSGQVCNSVWP